MDDWTRPTPDCDEARAAVPAQLNRLVPPSVARFTF